MLLKLLPTNLLKNFYEGLDPVEFKITIDKLMQILQYIIFLPEGSMLFTRNQTFPWLENKKQNT